MKKLCLLALLGAFAAPGCHAEFNLGVDDLFDDIEQEFRDMRSAYSRLHNNIGRAIDSGVSSGLTEYRNNTGRILQKVFGATSVSISSASNGKLNVELKEVVPLEGKSGGRLEFNAVGIAPKDIVVKVSSGKIVVQERVKPHGEKEEAKKPHVYFEIAMSPKNIKHKEAFFRMNLGKLTIEVPTEKTDEELREIEIKESDECIDGAEEPCESNEDPNDEK